MAGYGLSNEAAAYGPRFLGDPRAHYKGPCLAGPSVFLGGNLYTRSLHNVIGFFFSQNARKLARRHSAISKYVLGVYNYCV